MAKTVLGQRLILIPDYKDVLRPLKLYCGFIIFSGPSKTKTSKTKTRKLRPRKLRPRKQTSKTKTHKNIEQRSNLTGFYLKETNVSILKKQIGGKNGPGTEAMDFVQKLEN